MNRITTITRPAFFIFVSLLILFIVIQFAPAVQAPNDARIGLATRVSAATAAPTVPPPPAKPNRTQSEAPQGMLFFSAERGGRWELYAAAPSNLADLTQWRQLTRGYSPARAPALSRDGTRLAFQSRKDGNWEIYVLDLTSGDITRLTNDMAYDGAPTWSPDGKQVAFESYRSKDLDIWRMNADGTGLTNLTPDEPAYDFAPTWSPDGKTIVYVSWATGNKQLFSMTPDGKNRVNLSNNRFQDEQPAWSADGKRLAFVSNREACAEKVESSLEEPPIRGGVEIGNCQRREIYAADFDGAKLSDVRQMTFIGRELNPTWSPDGKAIAFLSARATSQPLHSVSSDGGISNSMGDDQAWIGSAVWSSLNKLAIGTQPVDEPPLYVEKPILSKPSDGSKYDFVATKDVYLAPSWGILSSTVSESFRALRARVKQDSGIDFLSALSDETRLIGAPCDNTCDYLSWHKAGRAVDTLLTLPYKGRETVVLVREDIGGEVYWHVYLRAANQDGSMGEPLKDAPWDLTYNARAILAPGQGGIEGPVEYGYFVDFTELTRQYGWSRISSHDDVDFDWRTNREGLEYWHFQKEDGLNWWQAMLEVYPPNQVKEYFDWKNIVKQLGKEPSRLYLKSLPPPPDAWEWFALVPNE